MITKVFLSGFLLIAVIVAGPVDGALDALARVHQFREVSVSPDGSMVAWVESIPSKDGSPASRSMIYVQDLRDPAAAPRRASESPETGEGLAWSRDGKLAFLGNGDSGDQLQLYVTDRPGAAVLENSPMWKGTLPARNGRRMGVALRCCGSKD